MIKMANSALDDKKTAINSSCFVCGNCDADDYQDLINMRTTITNIQFTMKISSFLGKDYAIILTTDDVICFKCIQLVNYVDKLEVDLHTTIQTFLTTLLSNYEVDPIDLEGSNYSLRNQSQENISITAETSISEKIENKNKQTIGGKQFQQCELPNKSDIYTCETKYEDPPVQTTPNNVSPLKYKCQKCKFTTNIKTLLIRHLNRHKNRINSTCLHCGKVATSPEELKCHIKEHTILNCRRCAHPFFNYQSLKMHLTKCDNAEMLSTHRCTTCQMEFLTRSLLRKHKIRNHYGRSFMKPQRNRRRKTRGILKQNNVLTETNAVELQSKSVKNYLNKNSPVVNNEVPSGTKFPSPIPCDSKKVYPDHNTTTDELLNDLLNFEDDSNYGLSKYSENGKDNSNLEASELISELKQPPSNDVESNNDLTGILSDLLNVSEGTHNKTKVIPPNKSRDIPVASTKELKTMYMCAICEYQTSIDAAMKKHISSHTKTEYKCDMCDTTFKTAHAADQHKRRHIASEKPLHCSICDLECSDKLHLKSHKKLVHKLHLKCNTCDDVFAHAKDLQIHARRHLTGTSQYKCDVCEKVFLRENIYKSHLEYEHRPNNKCKFCPKEFRTVRELRVHEQRHKRELHRSLKCSHCHKVLKTRTGYRVHMVRHTGEYKFFCEVCGRGFMSMVVLKEHMGVHTKEERYICDVCGQKFCFNATYRVHRMWHDNPKPYGCKECNLKFAHSSLLAVHRRRAHTGERPYVCSVCNIAFACSSSLKRHNRIHTGERPYVCSWCSRGFIERKLWAKHLANEHDDLTEINKKQKCEYKMVIRPDVEPTDDPPVKIAPKEVSPDTEPMQEYIIISNPSNLENMIFYEQPQLEGQIEAQFHLETNTSNPEIKFTITDGYQLVQDVQPSNLIAGVDTADIIVKTDAGEMIIRNGQLFPLSTEII